MQGGWGGRGEERCRGMGGRGGGGGGEQAGVDLKAPGGRT